MAADRSSDQPQRAIWRKTMPPIRPAPSKPTSQSMTKSCRLPVSTMSSSRSSRSFAGRAVRFATMATQAAIRLPCVSLPPNPPPRRRTSTVTALAGTPSTCATIAWHSEGCWFDESTCTSSPSPGQATAT